MIEKEKFENKEKNINNKIPSKILDLVFYTRILLSIIVVYFLLFIFKITLISLNSAFFLILSIFSVYYFYWKKYLKSKNKNENIINYVKESCIYTYIINIYPVLAILLFTRIFLFDISLVPSDSMKPTLNTNDYLLVSKLNYGIKIPLINKFLIYKEPKRWDVALFEFPINEKQIYVKRIVGLPGDKIMVKNNNLFINDKEVEKLEMAQMDNGQTMYLENFKEKGHAIIEINNSPVLDKNIEGFIEQKDCVYADDISGNFSCLVPQDSYFVMGDNRNLSFDSRYWGFVHKDLLYGKATHIIMNIKNMQNIGKID